MSSVYYINSELEEWWFDLIIEKITTSDILNLKK